jgi:hypothetical protein
MLFGRMPRQFPGATTRTSGQHSVRALAIFRRVSVRVNRRSDDRRRNMIERHTIRADE